MINSIHICVKEGKIEKFDCSYFWAITGTEKKYLLLFYIVLYIFLQLAFITLNNQ